MATVNTNHQSDNKCKHLTIYLEVEQVFKYRRCPLKWVKGMTLVDWQDLQWIEEDNKILVIIVWERSSNGSIICTVYLTSRWIQNAVRQDVSITKL